MEYELFLFLQGRTPTDVAASQAHKDVLTKWEKISNVEVFTEEQQLKQLQDELAELKQKVNRYEQQLKKMHKLSENSQHDEKGKDEVEEDEVEEDENNE